MINNKPGSVRRKEEEKDRFLNARKNLQEMQEEIAPFVKRRKFEIWTSAGRWQETSNLYK